MESLEKREVFAVSTWSGAVSGLWSNAGNWDVAPTTGDDLVFPASASQLTMLNDLSAGESFGNITFSGAGFNLTGNLVQVGGSVQSDQASGNNTIALDLTFTGNGTVGVAQTGANLDLQSTVNSAGNLTKSGQGTLTLSNTFSYSGNLNVAAGTLENNVVLPGDLSLGTGSILKGNGTTGSITSAGGNIIPGVTGTGLVQVSGNMTLDISSGFITALTGTTPGTEYGQIQAGGTIALGDATLVPSLTFTPSSNATFTIINNTGNSPIGGTFNGLAEGSILPIGSDQFRITYLGGDGNDVVLDRLLTTTTSLTSSVNPSVYGQPFVLTATVTSSNATLIPNGNVSFYSGTSLLGNGTLNANGIATFTATNLAPGTLTIKASYLGSGSYSSSNSSNLTQVINQANTTTSLVSTPNPSNFGDSVNLTATISPVSPGAGTPTGNVTFYNGNVTLGTATVNSNGIAVLTASNLTTGNLTVLATYAGDTNFKTSTSSNLTQVVNQSASKVTLTVSDLTPGASDLVKFTANVTNLGSGSSSPTGNVSFYSNDVLIGTGNITAGVATFQSTGFYLGLGIDSITAVYNGDTNFQTATSDAANLTAGTENERFINEAYWVILGHQADYQGLNAWNTYLQHGHTRNWVAHSMRNTRAGREALVQDIFNNYLDRTGTPVELIGAVEAGAATHTSATAVVLGSKEYFDGIGGGSIPTFIAALQTSLNTTFSAGLIEEMTRELAAGTLPAAVVEQALMSPAGLSSQADYLYMVTLGRSPTAAETAAFGRLQKQGVLWRRQQTYLMGSKEFRTYSDNQEGIVPS